MTPLSKLLNDANKHSWSNREIARRSGISPATVDHYMKGTHGQPTEEILQRFHGALDVSMAKLRHASGVPIGELEAWQPPAEVNRLNRRQRRALDELIRSFAATQEENNEDTGTPDSTGNQEGDGSIGVDGAPIKPKHPDNVRQLTRPNQPEEVDEEFDDTAPPPEALGFVARETPPGYKKGYDIDREDDDS